MVHSLLELSLFIRCAPTTDLQSFLCLELSSKAGQIRYFWLTKMMASEKYMQYLTIDVSQNILLWANQSL